MLTSPEVQFGPFTWSLETTPQGLDEDRLVVREEDDGGDNGDDVDDDDDNGDNDGDADEDNVGADNGDDYIGVQVTLGRVDGPGQPMSKLLGR